MNYNFSIDLPAFPGFYESFLYNSELEKEAVEMCLEDMPTYNLFPLPLADSVLKMYHGALYSLDFDGYKKAIVEKYADAVANTLERAIYRAPVCSFVIINPLHVVSPREYNFYTDRVECEIKIDAGDVLYYLEHNRAEYDKYLVDKFTSRSGFISFYSPSDPAFYDIDSWYDDTVFLSSALDFIVRNELGDDAEYRLSSESVDALTLAEFITFDEDITRFMESTRAEYYISEYNRLERQGALYVALMGNKYQNEARRGLESATEDLAREMIAELDTMNYSDYIDTAAFTA